jgi:hypothetical protein
VCLGVRRRAQKVTPVRADSVQPSADLGQDFNLEDIVALPLNLHRRMSL